MTLYGISFRLAEVSLSRLAEGLPRLAEWAQDAWPPETEGLDLLFQRAAETAAMALVGTTFAAVLALATMGLAARNITRRNAVRLPSRWFLNGLRGIDSFVFAIIFVAAVGLGPFAGVLGIAFHTWGSMAKLFSEAIETMPRGPIEAVELTGANRAKVVTYGMLPDALPSLTSVGLYMLEFNIRSSTVLGIVGAGGIGLELRNALDLLNFPRLLTIVVIILAMVGTVDGLSSALRRRIG